MDLWLQYASDRATALGLDFTTVSEAHAIVTAAVGPTWITEQEDARSRAAMPITAAHPLYRNLGSSTDPSVLEVCELARYLRTFQADPALPAIMQDLKTAKYEPVFLELAFAYRWRDAGAKVCLRTPTPHGEADFEATIAELPFTVEVSSFPHDALTGEPFRLAGVVTDTMTSIVQKQRPAAVRVTIERRATGITKDRFGQPFAKRAPVGVQVHTPAESLSLPSSVAWRLPN